MRVRVLSTCTGEKAVHHPDQLSLEDFLAGAEHVAAREAALPLRPAVELYTGLQHRRLLEGVRALRAGGHQVDLRILSAGYGLVEEDRPLAPYDATYGDMGRRDLRRWARQQRVPVQVRAFLEQPADLALVLLGTAYLLATMLPVDLEPGAPTLFLVGQGGAHHLPRHPRVFPVVHAVSDTRRYRAGLVGLKGAIAGRLLQALAEDPAWLDAATEPGLLDALVER